MAKAASYNRIKIKKDSNLNHFFFFGSILKVGEGFDFY